MLQHRQFLLHSLPSAYPKNQFLSLIVVVGQPRNHFPMVEEVLRKGHALRIGS